MPTRTLCYALCFGFIILTMLADDYSHGTVSTLYCHAKHRPLSQGLVFMGDPANHAPKMVSSRSSPAHGNWLFKVSPIENRTGGNRYLPPEATWPYRAVETDSGVWLLFIWMTNLRQRRNRADVQGEHTNRSTVNSMRQWFGKFNQRITETPYNTELCIATSLIDIRLDTPALSST